MNDWKVAVWVFELDSEADDPMFYTSFNPERIDEIAQFVLNGSDLVVTASKQPKGSPCNKDDPDPQPHDDLFECEILRMRKDDKIGFLRCSIHDKQATIEGDGPSFVRFFNKVKETNRTGLESIILCNDQNGKESMIEIWYGCPAGFVLAY